MPNVTVMEGSLSYAIQLVMEDFPRQTITLTQSDGTQTTLTTSDAISKIPVQFVFQGKTEKLDLTLVLKRQISYLCGVFPKQVTS